MHSWRYHGFSASAVAGSPTMVSTRARISSIFSSSESSYAFSIISGPKLALVAPLSGSACIIEMTRSRIRLEMSVQPSWTRSSSAKPPVCKVAKLVSHFCCQPGPSEAYHSGSIGWLLRTSMLDGVRWKT